MGGKMVHVIISQILKIMDDKPQNYTEKAFASLKNLRASFFLLYFRLFQISKQTSSFTWKNTSPPALSAHAANYASHIKRGFISSAFIYPIIYHKATLFKDNMSLLTEDRPKSQSWLTWNSVQNWSLKLTIFSLNGNWKKKYNTHQLHQGAGGGGRELANLWKIKLHNLLYFSLPLSSKSPIFV